jgi:chaperonin GroES
MGALITSGKELASVAEIFVGKMPGQNTPATTTMASIEQGMKVFTAVYKRIFRSLSEEFRKLYKLNAKYLNKEEYVGILDIQIGQDDFNTEDHDIFPGADPQAISSTEKLMKAQGLMELLPSGMLNPVEVIKRILVAQEQPNYEQLLLPQVAETGQPPEPQPDPKLQEMQMKSQLEQQKIQMQGEATQHKMELERADKITQLQMKAAEHAQDMEHKAQMNNLDAGIAQHKQAIFSAEGQQKLNLQAAEGRQKLTLKEQESRQKQKQMAQKPAKGGK